MSRHRFIIVGAQRSGTTVTHLCLRGHPQVSSLNDELRVSPFFTDGVAAFTYGAETELERDRGWLALFDTITTLEKNDEAHACGLKVAINSHQEAVVVANCIRMHLPGVKLILVNREDLVAQCGSWVRGEKSGQWHSWTHTADSGDDPGVLTIDPGYFADYALENRRIVSQLRTLSDSHDLLEFSFERQIADGSGWPVLFEHLGLSDMPVTWLRSRKVAPGPEEYIQNHDELRTILANIQPPSPEEERAEAMRQLVDAFDGRDEEALVETASRRAADGEDVALHRLVLQARPDGERWLAYLDGRILVKEVRCEEAIPRFDRFLDDNPHAIVLLHRACAHTRLEQWRAAHDDVVAAFETDRFKNIIRETQRWAFEMLEVCWARLNDAKLAQQTLDATRERLDKIPYYHYLQAVVHNARGDVEAGRASLQTAIELAPDFDVARKRLEQWAGQ